MKPFAFVMAILAMLMALIGLVRPDVITSFGRYSFSPAGLYVVAVVRLAIGLIFFFGAHGSRAPRTVRIIGVMICVAGVALAVFTLERGDTLSEWWSIHGPGFIRGAAPFVFALGAFIAYATAPRRLGNSRLRR
jgi:hypothetical protein